MPDISQITLPSGSTYDIKDSTARSQITQIQNSISGGIHYRGTTTSAIYDGATTSPIVVNGSSIIPQAGDLVILSNKEFIFDGTRWHEFGDMGSLKSMAFTDYASGPYTPQGTISQPTFTGSETSVTIAATPEGNVTISTGSGTANYTPAGSVSITAGSGTTNYTPAGTVSTPTITVTPSTTTVNSITAVGSLPSWTGTVTNENLTIGWSAGTLPTKGSNTTVATGIQSATSTQPSFTGTGTRLTASFSGTPVDLEASFEGRTFSSYGNFTPAGIISRPVFTGTAATITVSPSGGGGIFDGDTIQYDEASGTLITVP